MTRKRDELDGEALEAGLRSMGQSFRTTELSQLDSVLVANAAMANDPSYNQLVGFWLSENCVRLGLAKESADSQSNATWSRVGAGQAP